MSFAARRGLLRSFSTVASGVSKDAPRVLYEEIKQKFGYTGVVNHKQVGVRSLYDILRGVQNKKDLETALQTVNLFYNFGVKLKHREMSTRLLAASMRAPAESEALELIGLYGTWLEHPPDASIVYAVGSKEVMSHFLDDGKPMVVRDIAKQLREDWRFLLEAPLYNLAIEAMLSLPHGQDGLLEALVLFQDAVQMGVKLPPKTQLQLLNKCLVAVEEEDEASGTKLESALTVAESLSRDGYVRAGGSEVSCSIAWLLWHMKDLEPGAFSSILDGRDVWDTDFLRVCSAHHQALWMTWLHRACSSFTSRSGFSGDLPAGFFRALEASEDANAKRMVKVCRSTFGRCYPDGEDDVHAAVKRGSWPCLSRRRARVKIRDIGFLSVVHGTRSWHEGRWQWWHKRKQSKTALADRSYYHAMQLPSKVVFFNATSTMTWLTALTLLSSSAEIQRVLAAPDYAVRARVASVSDRCQGGAYERKSHNPRVDLRSAIRKKAGSQEACSTCDERVAKYRPEVWRPVVGKAPLTRTAKAKPANRGRPLDITYNTGLGEGLEAYRYEQESGKSLELVAREEESTIHWTPGPITVHASETGETLPPYPQRTSVSVASMLGVAAAVPKQKPEAKPTSVQMNTPKAQAWRNATETGAGSPAQGLPQLGDVPAEASEAARRPKNKRIPDTASKAEYDEYLLTHLPDAKLVRPMYGRVPEDEKDCLRPILVMDETSSCVFTGVLAKGVNPYATGLVTEALKFCLRQKVIMMTDAERSIKADQSRSQAKLADATGRDLESGSQPLPLDKVKTAMARELDNMEDEPANAHRQDMPDASFRAIATGKIAVVPPKDVGREAHLDRLDALMTESFGTKILPRIGRIGPEEFGGQATHGDHMHRIIRWSASGFHWEADPNYSRQIVERWHCALPFAGRYLVKYPKEVWHFEYQEQPGEVVVLTDSDWSACK
ncbi:hypothetical protein AK812_SmicGene29700 [Symbiodinium microadriaticum]|uniref:Uncharacterized protein n=1 Tax=Symbiodinium microadriaticum TaxID=2951 RepID=A0A1Q9D166_SYMMI|nr:hypothetical protein AK812_SmicGene29700 [Symbiodinium microadriaticum]